MTSVQQHLEAMDAERARLLRAHARAEHRHIPMRSCPACLRFHFDGEGPDGGPVRASRPVAVLPCQSCQAAASE